MLPTQPDAGARAVHVGRQPVYDRIGDVVGYELLFRDTAEATSATNRGAFATTQVIVAAFTEFGLEQLVGDRPCFVNLTREFLVGDLPVPFDYGQTVLEVLETIRVDDKVYAGICDLVDRGYTIALDDFVWTEETARLLPLASFVKVDMLDADLETVRTCLRRCREYPGISLVAERLETEEQLALAVELGFDCFQGHVLGRPHVITTQGLSPSKLRRLELLAALLGEGMNVDRVVALVMTDPALSIRLLRATNSAATGLTRPIASIRDGVVLLGPQRIRDWVALMVISDVSQASRDQVAIPLIRARMCQTLAECLALSPEAGFTVGLLSGVAELIGQPIVEMVRNLPLIEDVSTALMNGEGRLGLVLATVQAYERADVDALDQAPVESGELVRSYLAALAWSTNTLAAVGADTSA
jgi:EAL and modified HD-GYP domain-containing signal transduction protein